MTSETGDIISAPNRPAEDAPPSVHSGASRVSDTGSDRHAKQTTKRLCTFWMGNQCYGLDIGLVGGVISMESVTHVPGTPSTILGLCNLRGVPLALVNLAAVLRLDDSGSGEAFSNIEHKNALIVQGEGVKAGAVIDRVEAVFLMSRGTTMPAENVGEHAAVQGLFTTPENPGLVVTVLEPRIVLERLAALRFRRGGSDTR